MVSLIISSLAGGVSTLIFQRFFMSKKEEKDYALELLKVVNSDREMLNNKIDKMQVQMEKLQKEYNELLQEYNHLQQKYNQLKHDFNRMKTLK